MLHVYIRKHVLNLLEKYIMISTANWTISQLLFFFCNYIGGVSLEEKDKRRGELRDIGSLTVRIELTPYNLLVVWSRTVSPCQI